MSWYAVQHKPGQGDRALCHLQNQGIRAFFPKVAVAKIRGGKVCRKPEPLFPGYLFIQLETKDPVWAKVCSTRGVLRVVGFAGKPAPISDEVIDRIREGLEKVAELGGIRPGQQVELDEGPFKGLKAVFQAYDGEARGIVLIQFMQKQQAVIVPVSAIRA